LSIIVFHFIFRLCIKSFNAINDIWIHDKGTLEYYGECLKEIDSKPYLLVIESYLLKSMASIDMNLANKYKVFLNIM